MKYRSFLVILFFIPVFNGYCQYIPFKPDAVKDSVWIEYLFNKNISKSLADSFPVIKQVVYSPDKLVRIGVINLHTFIQVNFYGQLIGKDFGPEHGIGGKKIINVLKAHQGEPLYVIVATDSTDPATGYGSMYTWIETAGSTDEQTFTTYLAAAFHLVSNDIVPVDFEMSEPPEDYYRRDEPAYITHGAYTLELPKFMDDTGKCTTAFEVDLSKAALNYRTMSVPVIERQDTFVTKAYTGTFVFSDSVFKQVDDSKIYCPPLETFLDTIGNKTFKIGKYVIRHLAAKGFEEVGFGIFRVKNDYFYSGKIKLQSRVVINEEEGETPPKTAAEFMLQKDSSLLVLTKHFYTPYRNGACGSCWYEDYLVQRVVNDTVVDHLELSFNMGDWSFRADFIDCNQRKQQYYYLTLFGEEGRFGGDQDYSLKWLTPSTLRVRISGLYNDQTNDKEIKCYRDYIFSFGSKSNCASVKTGKTVYLKTNK